MTLGRLTKSNHYPIEAQGKKARRVLPTGNAIWLSRSGRMMLQLPSLEASTSGRQENASRPNSRTLSKKTEGDTEQDGSGTPSPQPQLPRNGAPSGGQTAAASDPSSQTTGNRRLVRSISLRIVANVYAYDGYVACYPCRQIESAPLISSRFLAGRETLV